MKRTSAKQTFSFFLTRDVAVRLAKDDKADIQFLPLPSTFLKDKRIGETFRGVRHLWVKYDDGKLDSIFVSATLTRDIHFEFLFGGKDEAAAKELDECLGIVISMIERVVAARIRDDERLAFLSDIIESLRIYRSGKFAVLTGSISYLNMGRLLALLGPQQE